MNPIAGPKTPFNFSGVRPWVWATVVGVPLALALGVAFIASHASALTPASAELGRHVQGADPKALVAASRSTVPPPPPSPPPQQVALADLGQQSQQQQVPSVSSVQAPVSPPTLSPAQIAAAERHAAVAAPWGSTLDHVKDAIVTPAQRVAANFQKDGSAYDVAPPSELFLEPGHQIDVVLNPIDSTVPGMVTGYVGKDVLGYGSDKIVIPALAKVTGHIGTSTLQSGQKRIGPVADWIILPNGHGIPMEGAPFTGPDGTTGIGVTVDNHDRRRIGNALVYGVIAAAAQIAQPQGSGCSGAGCSQSVGGAIAQGVGSQIASEAAADYSRSGQVQPTAHSVSGAQASVQIQAYIPLNEWVQQP